MSIAKLLSWQAYTPSDERNYLPRRFDRVFCFPAIVVCARMWITVHLCHERQHRVQNARIQGSSGLHIKID